MFDFDASKLLIVGVIALIFIPPKDLPRVLRQVGQFVGKMRRMASEFQGQFMEAMREADMADLRKEAQKLADAARIDTGFGNIDEYNRNVMKSLEGKPGEGKSDEPGKAIGANHEAEVSAPEPPPDDAKAFEALRSELRPLVDGDDKTKTPDERVPHSPDDANVAQQL